MNPNEKDFELAELKRAFKYMKPMPFLLPVAIILFIMGILYYKLVYWPSVPDTTGHHVVPLCLFFFGAVLSFGRYYVSRKSGAMPANSFMQEAKRLKDQLRKVDVKIDDKAISFYANTFSWVGSLYDKYVCFIIYKQNNHEFLFLFKNEFEIIKNPLPRKDYTFVVGKNKIKGTIEQLFWERYYRWKNAKI